MFQKIKEYLNHIVSVDESKFSVMVLALAITLGFGLWGFVHTHSFDKSLVTLLGYEIAGVTGVNVAKHVSTKGK